MTTDWISSDDAMSWAQETLGFMEAVHLISGRAHEGLIIARAERFRRGDQTQDDVDVPRAFWRGFGYSPLPQIWEVGDFQSQLNDDVPSRAFGVVFRRSDLEKFLPTRKAAATRTVTPLNSGRRPAPWWDDLWIEIARQLFVGDLKPDVQADIERAMSQWISDHGFSASPSTIRERARKLWAAIAD